MAKAKRFVVEIRTVNDAFMDDPRTEIARLLQEVANRVEYGVSYSGALFDINGNSVGSFEFKGGK